MSTHATAPDPRKIEDLRQRACEIRDEICRHQLAWYEAVTQQLHRLPSKRQLPCDLRREINELDEQLSLIISEYLDRRRI